MYTTWKAGLLTGANHILWWNRDNVDASTAVDAPMDAPTDASIDESIHEGLVYGLQGFLEILVLHPHNDVDLA